ncbi:MAG: DNA gyrase C-terminal beta-propeller domain-containing protein, partial [Acidobacteriota bacterium]
AIRFPEEDQTLEDGSSLTGVRSMGRGARGVRGIKLRPGDRVVSMATLEETGDILSISASGYGKRTTIEEYRRQSRGGLGIINLKVSEKTGPVVGVRHVLEGHGVMLIAQSGKLIRVKVDEVSRIGRATQGVRVMHLGDKDRVVAAAKIVTEDEEEVAVDELVQDAGGEVPADGEAADAGAPEVSDPGSGEGPAGEPDDAE